MFLRSHLVILVLSACIAILFSVIQQDHFNEPPPHLRAYPITKELIFHSEPGTVRDELAAIDSPRLSGTVLAGVVTLLRFPVLGTAIARLLLQFNAMLDTHHFAHSLPPSFRQEAFSVRHEQVPVAVHRLHETLATEAAQDASKRIPYKRAQSKVHALVDAYQRFETTPLKVAQETLRRIHESNQGDNPLNAVLVVHEDDVLAQARAATERYAQGKTLGPLDGVPIVIKPQFAIQGYPGPTSGMHQVTDEMIPSEDNSVVRRIRAAGCILVGLTHMSELGMSTQGDNPHFGPARNPHNRKHHTGGSSSGSAAAVAAGLVPIALGSDGGGSVRIPAALCGVTGLKPTYDRVEIPISSCSVFHAGPIATSPIDAALLYDVLVQQGPVAHHHKGPTVSWASLRVGLIPNWAANSVPALGSVAMTRAMDALRALGVHQFHNVTVPHMDILTKSHATIIQSEFSFLSDALWTGKVSKLSYDTQMQMVLSRAYTAGDLISSLHVRAYFLKYFETMFEEIDILLTPVTSILAPAIPSDIRPHGVSDVTQTLQLMHFVSVQNLLGLPAMSVPMGKIAPGNPDAPSTNNLPLSVQITANHWNEHILFAVANELYIETPL